MNGRKQSLKYSSVREFVESNGLKKNFLAAKWGISPFHMTGLVYPGRYRIALTDAQVDAIAADLNQSAEYVRSTHKLKAA